jgi:hypothetical protein
MVRTHHYLGYYLVLLVQDWSPILENHLLYLVMAHRDYYQQEEEEEDLAVPQEEE